MTANQNKIMTLMSSGAWWKHELENAYLGLPYSVHSVEATSIGNHKLMGYCDALGELIDEGILTLEAGRVNRL